MTDNEELSHEVPGDLLELFEVLEWEKAKGSRKAVAAKAGLFVSRAGWGARPPKSVTRLSNPAGCTFHYVGPKMGVFPHSSCATKVRGIQAFHMGQQGWSDIAYNMLVCPHGYVFEGRGRDVRSAANGTNTGNSSSHAICALFGDGDRQTDDMYRALLDARHYLMQGGTGTKTWCHSDWKATGCPGNPIRAWHRAGMPRPGNPIDPIEPEEPPVSDVRRVAIEWTSPQGYLVLFEDGGIANYGDAPSATDLSCFGAQPYPAVKAVDLSVHPDGKGIAVVWDNGNIDTRNAPHLGEPIVPDERI